VGLLAPGETEPAVDEKTLETGLEGVFVGGDARTGPATVVEAIAEARKFADTAAAREKAEIPEPSFAYDDFRPAADEILAKRGTVVCNAPNLDDREEASLQAKRCLQCDYICDKCVEVCPNRANFPVASPPGFKNPFQIVHIDDFCNECGNCATFCPHEGRPYRDKFTVFGSERMFSRSGNPGSWIDRKSGKGLLRLDGTVYDIVLDREKWRVAPSGGAEKPAEWEKYSALIIAVYRDNAFLVDRA
jgi:putative selenate reductase